VILPEKNRKDLHDIPDEARKALKFHFISNVSEVLALALHKKPKARKRGRYKSSPPAGTVN